MKRCISCCLVFFMICCMSPCAASRQDTATIEINQLEWTWNPLDVATFEGTVHLGEGAPDKLLLKLSFSAFPESGEPGEVVFSSVDGKKLTLRKQKPEYTVSPENRDTLSFVGNWKTPDNAYLTRVEITCSVYDESGAVLIAENKLTESRNESEILAIDDGRIRLPYNFPLWTRYAAAAAAAVWLLAIFRIIVNKRRKKR